jgi:hypothetical protein
VHHALHLSVYSGKMVEAMRESWTDARLDDFAAHTDQRFDSLERRMEAGFAAVNARSTRSNAPCSSSAAP